MGPSHLYTKTAPVARRIFDHQCKTTFATQSPESCRDSRREARPLRVPTKVRCSKAAIQSPRRQMASTPGKPFITSRYSANIQCRVSPACIQQGENKCLQGEVLQAWRAVRFAALRNFRQRKRSPKGRHPRQLTVLRGRPYLGQTDLPRATRRS
jgi:hypothetical protein